MLTARARSALIALVTVVWVLNIAAGVISDGYEPDPAVNGVFSGVIGAVFAAGTRQK